jgi:hypothetical protein
MARVISAVVGKATDEYVDRINKGLLPGLQKIKDYLYDNIVHWDRVKQGMGLVKDFITDKLIPAIGGDNSIQRAIQGFNLVLHDFSQWFERIGQGIDYVVGALHRLADAINNTPDMPDAMKGKSPPPMAKWMNAIGDQTAYAANAMNAVGSSIRGVPASPMAIMAGSSSMTTNNNQRNVNLNYHTTYAPPASTSLAIASALSG